MSVELQLVKEPPLSPYWCGRCRAIADSREYFIDSGIDIEIPDTIGVSRIYLCNACMKDFIRIDPQAEFVETFNAFVDTSSEILKTEREKNNKWQYAVDVCEAVGIDLEHLINTLGDSVGAKRENQGITRRENSEPKSVIEDDDSIGTAADNSDEESGNDASTSESSSLLRFDSEPLNFA